MTREDCFSVLRATRRQDSRGEFWLSEDVWGLFNVTGPLAFLTLLEVSSYEAGRKLSGYRHWRDGVFSTDYALSREDMLWVAGLDDRKGPGALAVLEYFAPEPEPETSPDNKPSDEVREIAVVLNAYAKALLEVEVSHGACDELLRFARALRNGRSLDDWADSVHLNVETESFGEAKS